MFRHKVPAIKVARDRLLDLPVEQARTGALVLGGLRRACDLADTLDSCITEDMTFAKPDLPEEGEERRLLEFFETSEEWSDPETEVGSWYWKLLPERLSR